MNPILEFFNIIQYESEIRNVNLIIHIVTGSVAVIVGLFNLILFKYPKLHKTLGKIFFWSVVCILLTSIISNLITLVFPFYILIFVSYYLIWFSIGEFHENPKILFENKIKYYWTNIINIKAIITSLFMLFFALAGIVTFNLDLFYYILLGPLLFYYSIRDFISLRKGNINDYRMGSHRYKILFSYMVVLIGFAISQFSWVEGYYKLLLWGGPLMFTIIKMIVIGIVFSRKETENSRITN